ncbi:MAG: SMC-Scp complex subunit ScpB [Candidatus Thermoplasmatota archaeon]|nr:SMC-Scp complex subunit ScpB [Candidatus Thermoplasmatota archaeon]
MDEDDTKRKEEELPPMLLVEAALFSSGKPVSVEDIGSSTGIEAPLVKLYLKKLSQTYSRRDTSLEVFKAGNKYSLRVKEVYVEGIRALAAPEVNPKLLKTAALIAYHQPVKQSDLVDMYGPRVYDHVKELMHMGLVRSRREGSTKVLTTTHRFSETFGISSTSKKKVKGHVRERVLERLEKVTLDSYQAGDGGPMKEGEEQGEEDTGADTAEEKEE